MRESRSPIATAPREESLNIRGARVHYFRGGTSAPVLYLHEAAFAGEWLPIHRALAAHFDLIAPDHLGFGRSERPEWLEGVDDLVLHYLDLLDALELERVHVVGSGFGGWIAAELAAWQGHRLRKLVLVDAAGLHVPGAPVTDVFMLNREQVLRASIHDQGVAEQLLAGPLDDAAMREYLLGQETLALLGWNPYLHNPKLARRLYRVQAPTLVLWGEHDQIIPLAHGQAYAAGIPNARLEIMPNSGHLPQIEQPERLAQLVAKFLSS